jgi:LysR family glycine cleavage system transcriptional activator
MSTRHRPLSLQSLRAFEAVARRLSFRLAGEELFLTQSAISRQIKGLEDELGAQVFQRDTRQVALTAAGLTLQRAVQPLLERLDGAVRQIRSAGSRPRVAITTFASFATLWLIPRLEAFQRRHPALDIRIAAHDALHDMDDPDIDMALRYCHPDDAPPGALLLFGEVLAPVVSPWYLERARRGEIAALDQPGDLAGHTLLEVEGLYLGSSPYRSWAHWLADRGLNALQPRSWVHLNYDHQRVQAAQASQGVVLARLPMVADMLTRGELVEPFGAAGRDAVPYGYWLILASGAAQRPEVLQLRDWVAEQAEPVRRALPRLPPE